MLRDFLFRKGIQRTVLISNPNEIIEHVAANCWPIIFVDSIEQGVFDSFGRFEKLFSTPGFQLFTYVICGPSEDRRFPNYGTSFGATAWLQKPLKPAEATTVIDKLFPQPNDPWYDFALKVSKLLIQGEDSQVIQYLTKLTENETFQRSAEIALLHHLVQAEQYPRAETVLERILEKHSYDLRTLCEAATFYKKVGQISKAVEFHQRIRRKIDLPHRTWEHLILCLDTNNLDGAAVILEDLSRLEAQREHVGMATAKIMSFMGLDEYVPIILKNFPNQHKIFEKYINDKAAQAGASS